MCYESSKLNENEHNYATHDLKLAMIIHSLNMWRHYPLGRTFVLMSNPNRLRHFLVQQNINAKKDIWLAMINEFDFEVRYINEKEKRVKDSLSRRAQLNHIQNMSSYRIDLHDWIL